VLVVGEGAKVSAEITCGTVIVHGEVNGNIRAKSAIELHHPARMRGNIESPSLMIEKGVMFEGQAKMEGIGSGASKPATVSPPPTPVAVK
jgi:cytoskeletal protein CcmA (bactofilin family)